MKSTLAPGIKGEKTVTTTPDMGISHLGEGARVLSTPAMIGIMEKTCLETVLPHLDATEGTVGTMVHVWHRAPIETGKPVTCRCKLLEKDRRKLLFEVEVVAGDLKLGDGTHERFVVDTSKFSK
ncbi:MAG: thioesterase family protein [Candidatus Lambdaproteobacteria bacterium]|nr:thioesterase family protein [Candidatus Lambdaproteobacteria bacterium]